MEYPDGSERIAKINEVNVQAMVGEAIARQPVTEKAVPQRTEEDEVLKKVLQYVQKGWPSKLMMRRLNPTG